jgi:hypothetical protein
MRGRPGITTALAANKFTSAKAIMHNGIDLSGYSRSVATGIAGAQRKLNQFFNGTPPVSPRPFDRTTRQSVLSSENAISNEPWGDVIGEKAQDITQMYCINLNGITLDKKGGKFDTVCRCMKEVQADIFSGQEHKLNTNPVRSTNHYV